MRPTWLIEAGVYGTDAEPLLKEIRHQGMLADLVSHQTLQKEGSLRVSGRLLGEGDCVLGYGTFPFARQIQLHRRWLPGAWCNPEGLDCCCYFAHFGKHLLNQHYAILPGVEAIRQRDWLYQVFGKDDEVFVRPTGCDKAFTRRCIQRDDFALALGPARYDPATLVVVASPRQMGTEWRLVVSEEEVVAASQYAIEGSKAVGAGCLREVCAFGEGMLQEVHWRPDPVFMMDVCVAEGQFWLVELGGFSCCWLYACDMAAVVARAGEVAMRVWGRKWDDHGYLLRE